MQRLLDPAYEDDVFDGRGKRQAEVQGMSHGPIPAADPRRAAVEANVRSKGQAPALPATPAPTARIGAADPRKAAVEANVRSKGQAPALPATPAPTARIGAADPRKAAVEANVRSKGQAPALPATPAPTARIGAADPRNAMVAANLPQRGQVKATEEAKAAKAAKDAAEAAKAEAEKKAFDAFVYVRECRRPYYTPARNPSTTAASSGPRSSVARWAASGRSSSRAPAISAAYASACAAGTRVSCSPRTTSVGQADPVQPAAQPRVVQVRIPARDGRWRRGASRPA